MGMLSREWPYHNQDAETNTLNTLKELLHRHGGRIVAVSLGSELNNSLI